jgi:hypothetical protein
MKAVCVVASLVLSATHAAAQWVNFPTPGLPRTADGKPNLAAPAPRTADGTVDLTGLWNGPGIGLETLWIDPVDAQPWANDLQRQRAREFFKSRPQYQCRPSGPQAFEGMRRIVQTPTLITLLNPDLTYRQIFLDGRTLETNPFPVWMGYSLGRWEDDTLIVDSSGFNDRTWLNNLGFPHTDQLRMTERYRRPDVGRLTVDVTFTDPGAYNRPLRFTVDMQLATDTQMLETVCEGNTDDWVGSVAELQKSAVNVPREVLSSYVGVYRGRWGTRPRDVEVTLDGGELHVTALLSSERAELIAVSDSLFTSTEGLSYRFFRDANGVVTHVDEVHASGNYPLRRQGTRVGQPPPPAADFRPDWRGSMTRAGACDNQ